MGVLTKKNPESDSNKAISQWLETISSQLERLIVCQEKRLSGEVIKEFNSKQHIENLQGGK